MCPVTLQESGVLEHALCSYVACVSIGVSVSSFSALPDDLHNGLQVLFLLYHYFEAREVYNAIRVFIAGYVWMTGYGNFLYYYKTKDFSFGR